MANEPNDTAELVERLLEIEESHDQAVKLALDLVLDVIRDLCEVGGSPTKGASKSLCAAIAHLGNGVYQLRKEVDSREAQRLPPDAEVAS